MRKELQLMRTCFKFTCSFLSAGRDWFGDLFTLIYTLERVTVSVTQIFFFVYSSPVYLPEVIFLSQSSSLFLLGKKKKTHNNKTPKNKTHHPTTQKIIKKLFRSLLMNEMESERQQTAAL